MDSAGWKFYILFICLNFVDFGLIALVFPETKGPSFHYKIDFKPEIDVNARKIPRRHEPGFRR